MCDPHRVLVDAGDRIDNIGQIRALIAGGFDGLFSFEPFAPSVAKLVDAKPSLEESIAYIRGPGVNGGAIPGQRGGARAGQ